MKPFSISSIPPVDPDRPRGADSDSRYTGSLAPARSGPVDRLVFVDVLRGLAILGVIMVHVRYLYADLPAEIRQIGSLGRYGVDLFFVVSAFTLFRSNRVFSVKVFMLRRFLRIAPIYYLGILFYTVIPWIVSPSSGLDVSGMAANLLFLNGWIPGMSNSIVPGGWSISGEVAFYCLLPFAIPFVTTLKRALVGFIATLIITSLLLNAASEMLGSLWSVDQTGDFLTYSPLVHLATFCLGIVLFHLLPWLRSRVPENRHGLCSLLLVLAGCILLPVLNLGGLPGHLPRPIIGGVPVFLVAAGVALGLKPSRSVGILILQAIGVVSYGVYLIHFGILDFVETLVVGILPIGSPSVLMFSLTLGLTTVLSVAGAFIVHRTVEVPVLSLAPRLSRRILRAEPSKQSPAVAVGQPSRP